MKIISFTPDDSGMVTRLTLEMDNGQQIEMLTFHTVSKKLGITVGVLNRRRKSGFLRKRGVEVVDIKNPLPTRTLKTIHVIRAADFEKLTEEYRESQLRQMKVSGRDMRNLESNARGR